MMIRSHVFFIHILLWLIAFLGLTCKGTEKGDTVNKEKEINRPEIAISNLRQISRVTGKTLPGETFPNSNNSLVYDVFGTDLGIMWQMEGSKIGLFFGDTNGEGFEPFLNGGGGNGSNWRSNVLAFSDDSNLEDGLTFSSMVMDNEGKAREIIAGGKANPQTYQTSIPTGAIRANGVDYVHYMNIYNWNGPDCSWLTNFSSLYASQDNGETWNRKEEVTFRPLSHFSQVTYAKKEGIVYMIGTRSGRGGAGYLARFREDDILKMDAYEYWNGKVEKWIMGDETAATPIISSPVGEASLMYHEKYERWILTYNYDYNCDQINPHRKHAIVYRDAEDITKWSQPEILVTDDAYPGLYCAYLHPMNNNGDKLYFLMSLWGPYNVFLMSVDLSISNTTES